MSNKNLYIDAEWFPTQEVFLIGYAREDAYVKQLYSKYLTEQAFRRVLDKTVGHIFFYGPDIALLEKHFGMDIRNNYDCVNLLNITRRFMPHAKNWRLDHMEKVFKLQRSVAKYKKSIFQIYSDWNDPRYRKRVLQYNLDDVRNLVLVKQKMVKRYDIHHSYFNTILLK